MRYTCTARNTVAGHLQLVVADYIWKDSNVFFPDPDSPASISGCMSMLVCTVLNMLLIGISVIFADKYRILKN